MLRVHPMHEPVRHNCSTFSQFDVIGLYIFHNIIIMENDILKKEDNGCAIYSRYKRKRA